jgi:hypothetical protein
MDQQRSIVVTGTLSDLFPPDHPETAWLLRLMIIRDDLDYELRTPVSTARG